MTRDEQIREAAKVGELPLDNYAYGFISGAEWADANPPDSRTHIQLQHRIEELEEQIERLKYELGCE